MYVRSTWDLELRRQGKKQRKQDGDGEGRPSGTGGGGASCACGRKRDIRTVRVRRSSPVKDKQEVTGMDPLRSLRGDLLLDRGKRTTNVSGNRHNLLKKLHSADRNRRGCLQARAATLNRSAKTGDEAKNI